MSFTLGCCTSRFPNTHYLLKQRDLCKEGRAASLMLVLSKLAQKKTAENCHNLTLEYLIGFPIIQADISLITQCLSFKNEL